jgi:hypothetical protein
VGKAKYIILFNLFDLITLFQTYENRIFEAFSHGSVVNDNYMFSFKWILRHLRVPKFLESLIKFKIKNN